MIFDSNAFYKKRLSSHIKELGRYLRYIFTGHTAIVMFFIISVAAYYYQQALVQLPENFPTAWIIGISFGLLVSYSPVRTLLKEADLVFIIVAEDKMAAYFRNCLIYSFVIQLYVILLVVAGFGPLYFETYPERTGLTYLLTLLIVLFLKTANLLANWWMLKIRDKNTRTTDIVVRALLNIFIFYFMIKGDLLFAGVTTILFFGLFLYANGLSKKQAGINWGLLIEKDQYRMQAFYQFANMFSDVPHLKARVKKRQWLVSMLTKNVPMSKQNTYPYLFRITFIRSGDYIAMYLRLIIIGGLFVYLIPNLWMKLAFTLLFLYLSTFQMMALYHHHRPILWLDIYPVDSSLRKQALVKLLYQVGFIQGTIYSLLFLIDGLFMGFAIAFVSAALFHFMFMNGYVKKKLA